MSTQIPTYLVESQDGRLHGYYREDILQCDLAIHKRDGEPAKRVLKLASTLPVSYAPIEDDEDRCRECGHTPETGACHFCKMD